MKILLYDITSYMQRDLIHYLQKMGHKCRNIIYKTLDKYEDEFFERKFEEQLKKDDYDFVMSTNFSPIVAKICNRNNKKYIAWVYDSPIDVSQIEYYQYPTSYIFVFDRIEAERIKALGGVNIHHSTLAVNTNRLNSISLSAHDRERYSCDISFVGQLYPNALSQVMSMQSDYHKGYINGILDSQVLVYGYNFLNEVISDELAAHFAETIKKTGVNVYLTKQGLINAIACQVTRTERIALLSMLNEYFNLKYYGFEKPQEVPTLKWSGTAEYYNEMPKIFKTSRLNLNPTLKNIQSGIPLRALDILGSGGVLFSNYQPELTEYFVDGQDIIMYDSIEDAICKADFYLRHENLRLEIQQNGYQIAATQFTFPDKINNILKTAGII